jgi:hypothetical protein
MIMQVAILDIKPDKVEKFIGVGRDIVRHYNEERPPQLHAWQVVRAMEDPNRFVLHGYWDRAEDHTGMAETDWGRQMTELIQDCVAGEATILHCELVDGAAYGGSPLER